MINKTGDTNSDYICMNFVERKRCTCFVLQTEKYLFWKINTVSKEIFISFDHSND